MSKTKPYLEFPCIKVTQPMGDFFIGSIKARDLCEITEYDFRKLVSDNGFASYLGIQREVNSKRVQEISKYVGTKDACFPTAVILAVPGKCAKYLEKENKLRLSAYKSGSTDNEEVEFDKIAVVLDGQHRIAGLKEGHFDGNFEVNVSIFIDADISDQAYLFSTVNLAQTKVNKSLVYDLFDLAKKRSPQKTCHNIAVALDQQNGSPFHQRIKRLGVATKGRFDETITQATFVKSLLKYISDDPVEDRDLYLRNKKPEIVSAEELRRLLFRNMFILEEDLKITDVIWNYFDAVKEKWPSDWDYSGESHMLNKTNGFKALMRFLKPAYLSIAGPGKVPKASDFASIFNEIKIADGFFTTNKFKPGASGEAQLFSTLMEKSGFDS